MRRLGACPRKTEEKERGGRPFLDRAGVSKTPDMAKPAGTSNGEAAPESIPDLPPQILPGPRAIRKKVER